MRKIDNWIIKYFVKHKIKVGTFYPIGFLLTHALLVMFLLMLLGLSFLITGNSPEHVYKELEVNSVYYISVLVSMFILSIFYRKSLFEALCKMYFYLRGHDAAQRFLIIVEIFEEANFVTLQDLNNFLDGSMFKK